MEQELEIRDGVDRETIETVQNMGSYKYGWETEIEMDYAPKGISEEIVRLISKKNDEGPKFKNSWSSMRRRHWMRCRRKHVLLTMRLKTTKNLSPMKKLWTCWLKM